MTATAAAPKLGFRACACGHLNHYRTPTCAGCGAPNVKADPNAPQQPQDTNVIAHPSAPDFVAEPYVVLRDFRTQIGDVTGVFKTSMVLNDFAMIQRLVADGCPVTPVRLASGMACCPKCNNVFPLMIGKPAAPKRTG